MKKTYWACVEGRPDPLDGTWRDCLIKVYGRPQAEVVPAEHPDGRPAVLHYRTLALAEWGAWLEIELETGRTHQIRIQAASRGFPLWGDFQYGAHTPFGLQHENQRLRAIALHARTLEFQHPTLKSKALSRRRRQNTGQMLTRRPRAEHRLRFRIFWGSLTDIRRTIRYIEKFTWEPNHARSFPCA